MIITLTKTINVAILLLCLSALPSAAQNESFKAAEGIPASIHNVMSGGLWTRGKDEGFFRAVVTAGGVEHVVHRLYIQWLRSDAKTQSYELVRTVNVKELNTGHGHVLEVKTSFGDINSFKISVIANSRGGKAKRFAITVKGATGNIQFGLSKLPRTGAFQASYMHFRSCIDTFLCKLGHLK